MVLNPSLLSEPFENGDDRVIETFAKGDTLDVADDVEADDDETDAAGAFKDERGTST